MANRRKTPAIHWASDKFFEMAIQSSCELPGGRWVPARPLPYYSWIQRWRAAWLVFTGKADALRWLGQ